MAHYSIIIINLLVIVWLAGEDQLISKSKQELRSIIFISHLKGDK